MKYKIKFVIWEEVKHAFSEDTFLMLGYEILPNWLRYVCINSKQEYKYCYEIELKAIKKNNKTGFLELNTK